MLAHEVVAQYPEFFPKGGVLRPKFHRKLVQGARQFCRTAGIPWQMLSQDIGEPVGKEETDWLNGVFQNVDNNVYGLVYAGPHRSLHTRMQMLVAELLRNYVDARLRSSSQIVASWREGETYDCTVLLIPDFHTGRGKQN